jgi:hypothetical protein
VTSGDAEVGASLGPVTGFGLGVGVGVASATDGVVLGLTTGVGLGVDTVNDTVGIGDTEGAPDSPNRIAPKNTKAMTKAPPKIAQTIGLRFGGGADVGGGSADGGGVAGRDTGTLVGRLAAAMFSFSAFQNS